MSVRITMALVVVAASTCCLPSAFSQEETADESDTQLSQVGALVDFVKDVQPIFEAKCVACHGPDEAKNDFRMDDSETVLDYLEPEDLESSSLWTDYLVTDDPDMRMPPPGADEHEPLSGAELATIKLWIEEGAKWPENITSDAADEKESVSDESTAARIWMFQGLFHPASVHFPIALVSVSAAFVFLSFFKRETFEPAAFHCLWIGALAGVASCVMGWAYAGHEGYGAGYSFDLENSAIDRHRWLGIVVAILSLCLIPLASSARRSGERNSRALWFFGSLLLMAGVSLVGYQGGELTYGEDHYFKEFERLFPSEEVLPEEVSQDSGESGDEPSEPDEAAPDEPAGPDEAVQTGGEAAGGGDQQQPEGEGSSASEADGTRDSDDVSSAEAESEKGSSEEANSGEASEPEPEPEDPSSPA